MLKWRGCLKIWLPSKKQQGLFTKLHTSRKAATKTSFVISHKIAKNSKPFSEGEFVKECLMDFAALICPEKREAFKNVSLSRRTVNTLCCCCGFESRGFHYFRYIECLQRLQATRVYECHGRVLIHLKF